MTGFLGTHGIDAHELRTISVPLVNHHHLELATRPPQTSLLTGYMRVTELEPGMHLRLADIHDHFGLTTRAELPAGVKIALVVSGHARVKYGRQDAELGPSGSSVGLVSILPTPDRFVRQGRIDGHERTITLSLTPQWLAQRGLGRLLEPGHRGTPRLIHWTPSDTLLSTAQGLFSPSPTDRSAPLYHLHLSGFALTLASEALKHTQAIEQSAIDEPAASRRRLDPRLAKLMALIDSGQARKSTQAELARQLGMSLSNLQRRFRDQCGEALGHYLRRHALGVAREALVRERVSVEIAAELAGYTSASNFTTAFRREFGITPSDCRAATQQARLSIPGRPRP
ncbi:AraC family transcriptional regulator [Marinobacter nanhaiticus D15-8W]|uniref:AraC family transcriptional regulator n=1 Tax=Marinobacter nanhaiticus D15-8W TaxID=626887 RepID=N6X4G9_9GAMM|nr:AraC family transcriptional regulator [Marinobacter nanhaiticus]ENO15978.1 AraC family transcriptional regulator [Marinobacter nanhaiticus D15-8W]BES73164.1 AraC family transcriptional regulator [Marinobacter nanhaiticus D15-8W]